VVVDAGVKCMCVCMVIVILSSAVPTDANKMLLRLRKKLILMIFRFLMHRSNQAVEMTIKVICGWLYCIQHVGQPKNFYVSHTESSRVLCSMTVLLQLNFGSDCLSDIAVVTR